MTDDTELQSTVARVLAREPEPGGIGDLHADVAVLRSENASLRDELARLKAGKFTPEEIHDICHNLHGTVDARGFADGCTAEQRKLYGCAPDADELARVRQQHLVIMTGHDCTWGIGSGRHCPDDKPCRTHKLAAAVAERDELREALRPFAALSQPHQTRGDELTAYAINSAKVTFGDYRRAAALVARHDTSKGQS